MNNSNQIAVFGTGFVGRAWSIVFARAGHDTVMYGPVDGAAQSASETIAEDLPDLSDAGLLGGRTLEEVAARLTLAGSLDEALEGAVHVQESAPERVDVKRILFADLDRITAPETVLASSTSGIPASQLTEELSGRRRSWLPTPSIRPTSSRWWRSFPRPWTDPEAVARTRVLMAAVGQEPISTTR